jgi:hypothetical protein
MAGPIKAGAAGSHIEVAGRGEQGQEDTLTSHPIAPQCSQRAPRIDFRPGAFGARRVCWFRRAYRVPTGQWPGVPALAPNVPVTVPAAKRSVHTHGFYANAAALANPTTGQSLFGPLLRAVTTRVLVRR